MFQGNLTPATVSPGTHFYGFYGSGKHMLCVSLSLYMGCFCALVYASLHLLAVSMLVSKLCDFILLERQATLRWQVQEPFFASGSGQELFLKECLLKPCCIATTDIEHAL